MTSWHGIKALLSIDAWLEADGLLLADYVLNRSATNSGIACSHVSDKLSPSLSSIPYR